MKKTDMYDDVRKNLIQELRRGSVVIAVLSRLSKEHYGYTLLKELNELGFPIEQNTLYPLLRRLETQGLLSSQWKVEDPRPRRYYIRSETGTEVFHDLIKESKKLQKILEVLCNEK